MRDQPMLHPFGRLSMRRFLLFIATLTVATFAYLFISSPTAHAADLQWEGGDIVYQGNKYLKKDDIKAGSTTGLPVGTKVYIYFSGNVPDRKAQVIYFAPNTDPAIAQQATYIVYNFTPPDQYSALVPPQAPQTLTATPQSGTQQAVQASSCVVEGVGWIVCPVTKFLSKAMDWLFDVLSGFLNVRPSPIDQQSPLYRSWSMMRSIANVLFVIGFLVMIYSQVTGAGLSNYGIKRMLPRLIIAAILVNASYWICAILVDISNIAGYSIQDLFIDMRKNTVGPAGNGWTGLMSFESLSGFILSGGTAVGAAGVGLYAFTAGAAGGIFMLLPMLLGVIVAALVALLVLAARQALITILIVVSPLAFVAYLLPNTEKYFDKGRELFIKMLLIFPMFAVLFSGSQLAGDLIIQNANSINLIILGMGVKVAPVVITPFLMKLSGSLLGKVAGIVNNPGKGFIDRTRNMAQERADQRKARALSGNRSDLFARGAQRIDRGRRKRSGWQKANEARADANWANSEEYSNTQQYDSRTSQIKDIGDLRAQNRYAISQQTNSAIQDLDLRARVAKVNLDVSKTQVEGNWEELRAGNATNLVDPVGLSLSGIQRYRDQHIADARSSAINAAVEGRRLQSAQNMQQGEISRTLQNNVAIRDRAGGIDPNGSQRALADALKKQHEIRGEAVKNANSIIEHSNLPYKDVVKLTLGTSVAGISVTEDVREAAIKHIASGGNVGAIQEMMDQIDTNTLNENQLIALSSSFLANGSKPKFVSSSASGKIAQNQTPLGKDGVNQLIHSAVTAGKYGAETLATQDETSLERVLEGIKANRQAYAQATIDQLKADIQFAQKDDILSAKLGERRKVLDQMLSEL